MMIEEGSTGVIQDCWKRNEYVWCQNVQFFSSDDYSRKYQAIELGFQTCLIVPFRVDKKFVGCIEFFHLEEWQKIPELVKKLEFYTNISTEKKIDQKTFNL